MKITSNLKNVIIASKVGTVTKTANEIGVAQAMVSRWCRNDPTTNEALSPPTAKYITALELLLNAPCSEMFPPLNKQTTFPLIKDKRRSEPPTA